MKGISEEGLDTLFRSARSHNKWLDKPLPDGTLESVYELMKWGPTSGNCCPARLVFCITPEAKERLSRCAMEGNRAKIISAPATVIIGHDIEFHSLIPKLFPHRPEMAETYVGNESLARETAFRNGTLQGAYFMLAARSLGLDCGPMSGFDNAAVDAEFFAGTSVRSNFICSIGYGDDSALWDRLPRLEFDEACRVL